MSDERGMKARDTSKQLATSTSEIVAKAKTNELQSTHRVYVKEWYPEFRHEDELEVGRYFAQRFGGRVRAEDAKTLQDAETGLYTLWLRLWTVKGEWKDVKLADAHRVEILVDEPDREVEVVARNSKREHALTAYGKLKLPQKVSDPGESVKA